MILHITEAKHLEGYRIEVAFNDGKRGVADLREALHGPVFEPLRDKKVFADFRVDEELQTIVWSNGADLAPEYVYYQAFKDDPELQPRFRDWGYIGQKSDQEKNLIHR
ncbi:MAG: DUF2442 domain-containing protein [Candidatus Omnitrophica bacterium]|nr:DUF2442 domain-containing protein [Candidatus Omnitrophota bacterium]